MSSETKITKTKVQNESLLVPELRFPEFRAADGWKEKRLGAEGELLSSLTGKVGSDFDAGEARFITYMNVFSNTFVDPKDLRLVNVREDESQNAVVRGDVFFTISSETPEDVGMSSVLLDELENCYLNSFCALFRFFPSRRPNTIFMGYLLRQPSIRRYFTMKAQGSTRFNLSKDAFRSLPFFLPSIDEQRKIAECLASSDEVIAAQARKVDALKKHKKGLMQDLFPRKGETQPRRRFPEFQNAGEWSQKKLDDLVHFQDGFAFKSTDFVKVRKDATQVIRITDINNKNINEDKVYIPTAFLERNGLGKYQVDDGDLLLSLTGAAGFNFFFWDGGPAVINQRTAKVTLKTKAGHSLLRLLDPLIHEKINERGEGQNNNLSKDFLSTIVLQIPEVDEQQRIAAYLSSLDTLITAETHKLEALKRHKRGVMQQLFPSPKGGEA
jgi:type I restriction enzyme S subunit